MKRLSGFTLIMLFCASVGLHAQTTVMLPAVAFVKTDRDTLHIKQLFADSAVHDYDMTSIINNIGAIEVDSIRQLAIIGMTPAGDRLIVGGTIGYKDQSSGGHVTYQGLFSLPWPLTTPSFLKSGFHFLLQSSGPQNFRPMGVLSKDGKQWFATLTSASQGSEYLTLYHGNTDGSGTIDSTTYGTELEDGVQMSNLAIDASTNTVLLVVCDRVADPSQAVDLGVTFFSWTPGNGNAVQALPFTNTYLNIAANDNYTQYNDNLSQTTGYPDSMFGLTVIPENDGHNAYIGLCTDPNHDNSIQLYSVEYTGSSLSITTPALAIPRAAIPSTENFFAGQNCGPYKEDIYGVTVSQCGNGGDVFVNSIGGDSALFITHESPDDCGAPRNIYSGIWYYDLSTQPSNAVLVYDDSSAQELQPVWVVMPYTIPAAPKIPGIAWQGGAAKSTFATVDTSKDSTITFTAVDTAQISTIIDSAKITGPNASEFTIPANMQSSVTLASTMTQAFPVTFAPVGAAGQRTATLTVYFQGSTTEGLPDNTITQALSGTAQVQAPPPNSVAEDPALSSSMTIEPNPFSTSTSVQLTVPSVGALGIVVHDALGRLVYTSDTREVGAGQTESFQFDAKSLGLPDGVYYVTAFLGERQASRAVVFVH